MFGIEVSGKPKAGDGRGGETGLAETAAEEPKGEGPARGEEDRDRVGVGPRGDSTGRGWAGTHTLPARTARNRSSIFISLDLCQKQHGSQMSCILTFFSR